MFDRRYIWEVYEFLLLVKGICISERDDDDGIVSDDGGGAYPLCCNTSNDD